MLIINVRDNENNRWKRKGKKTNKDRKQQMGDTSYGESVRGKWLCCTFKLGFLQLICKASLIFKSNLELALSFILKERKFYKPKHVVMECRCLKIWDCYPFWYSSILVLKWKQVSPV